MILLSCATVTVTRIPLKTFCTCVWDCIYCEAKSCNQSNAICAANINN